MAISATARTLVPLLMSLHVCRVLPETTDCSGLSLTEVPEDIPISTLTLLLDDNAFTVLESGMFSNLPLLQALSLSNNQLTALHAEALAEQHGLLDLDLSSNLIESFPKDLLGHAERRSPPLRSLDLSRNRINSVERASLFYLNRLVEIDLSYNELDESNFWKGSFFYLSGIRTIKLNNNHFTDVTDLSPILFRSAGEMTELQFTDNLLTRIPNGLFDQNTKLKTVDFRRNNIQFIAEKALAPLVALEDIEMGDNPSTCSSTGTPGGVVCDCGNTGYVGGQWGMCEVTTTSTVTTTTTTATTTSTTTVSSTTTTSVSATTTTTVSTTTTTTATTSTSSTTTSTTTVSSTTSTTVSTTTTAYVSTTSITATPLDRVFEDTSSSSSTTTVSSTTTATSTTTTTTTIKISTTPADMWLQPDESSSSTAASTTKPVSQPEPLVPSPPPPPPIIWPPPPSPVNPTPWDRGFVTPLPTPQIADQGSGENVVGVDQDNDLGLVDPDPLTFQNDEEGAEGDGGGGGVQGYDVDRDTEQGKIVAGDGSYHGHHGKGGKGGKGPETTGSKVGKISGEGEERNSKGKGKGKDGGKGYGGKHGKHAKFSAAVKKPTVALHERFANGLLSTAGAVAVFLAILLVVRRWRNTADFKKSFHGTNLDVQQKEYLLSVCGSVANIAAGSSSEQYDRQTGLPEVSEYALPSEEGDYDIRGRQIHI